MKQSPELHQPIDVDPRQLKQLLDADDIVLIDVREPFEHAGESIAGAVSAPLGSLAPGALRERFASRRLVFYCAGGKRSAKACGQWAASQDEPASHLAGGIAAWKAAGLPTIKAAKAGLPLIQQVHLTAGGLVLLGLALGAWVSPGFLLLSAFIGGGLMFAGRNRLVRHGQALGEDAVEPQRGLTVTPARQLDSSAHPRYPTAFPPALWRNWQTRWIQNPLPSPE